MATDTFSGTGRFVSGRHRNAKVTSEQVMQIRELYAQGWTQSRLCREFELSIGQIGKIVRGESWAKLPMIKTDAAMEYEAVLQGQNRTSLPTLSETALAESMKRTLELLETPLTTSPPLPAGVSKALSNRYLTKADSLEPMIPAMDQNLDLEPTGEGWTKLQQLAAEVARQQKEEFICLTCDKGFATQVELTDHSLEHLK